MAKRQADESSEKTKQYRIKANHTLTVGSTDDDGNPSTEILTGGELVSLTDKQAKQCAHAIEEGERRRAGRDGQTSRLKRKIAELEAQIEEHKAAAKARAKGDPNRDSAIESLKARGDNFIGRGEPDIGRVPPSVVDAFEQGQDDAEFADLESDTDVSGMKGLGNERSTDPANAPVVSTVHGAKAAPVFEGEPGQSQRPGAAEPSGEPSKKSK
jgi:hypothetical protein